MLCIRVKVDEWVDMETEDGKKCRVKAQLVRGKGKDASVELIFDDKPRHFLIMHHRHKAA